MEASGFILEHMISVHGYLYLSSYPCALIGEVKVGVCGVTWFSMASPAAPELPGKCWEQAETQLALCLTPEGATDPFSRQNLKGKGCAYF